jgi:hypothetical protein
VLVDDDIPLLLAVAEAAADMEVAPNVSIRVNGEAIEVCGFCGARAETPDAVQHYRGCHWLLVRKAILPLLREAE